MVGGTLEPRRKILTWDLALLALYVAIVGWVTYRKGIEEHHNIFEMLRWSFLHLRD